MENFPLITLLSMLHFYIKENEHELEEDKENGQKCSVYFKIIV